MRAPPSTMAHGHAARPTPQCAPSKHTKTAAIRPPPPARHPCEALLGQRMRGRAHTCPFVLGRNDPGVMMIDNPCPSYRTRSRMIKRLPKHETQSLPGHARMARPTPSAHAHATGTTVWRIHRHVPHTNRMRTGPPNQPRQQRHTRTRAAQRQRARRHPGSHPRRHAPSAERFRCKDHSSRTPKTNWGGRDGRSPLGNTACLRPRRRPRGGPTTRGWKRRCPLHPRRICHADAGRRRPAG